MTTGLESGFAWASFMRIYCHILLILELNWQIHKSKGSANISRPEILLGSMYVQYVDLTIIGKILTRTLWISWEWVIVCQKLTFSPKVMWCCLWMWPILYKYYAIIIVCIYYYLNSTSIGIWLGMAFIADFCLNFTIF